MRDFGADEMVRDHADHVTPFVERTVRHRAHQTDVAAAVDQPVTAGRDGSPEHVSGVTEPRIGTDVRTTEDSDARHGSIVARRAEKVRLNSAQYSRRHDFRHRRP